MLPAAAAFLLSMGVLAYFIPPAQWVVAVRSVPSQNLIWSTVFFFAGCLAMAERWRACLAYRVDLPKASHSLGIALIGNLLIPGRSGEPLRVFALAKKGLPAELSTSGVVQERLADQIFRILFLALALVLSGTGSRAAANMRMLAVLLGTLAVLGLLVLAVRYRIALARSSGNWLGRLPRLSASSVEHFVRSTLSDLGSMSSRPGGPQALVWGLLSFGLLAVHTNCVLAAFFGPESFTLTCVVMAFAPSTTAGKPGYYHFLLVASMVVFSADKELALKAAVVLHLYQGIFFTLWGVVGWHLLRHGPMIPRLSVPVVEEAPPR